MNYILNGKQISGEDKLTKDFKVKEFASKDGSSTILLDVEMVLKLQKLRDHLGVPIIINSAYRSPKHNANVGGAKNSQHVKGTAVDIRVSGYTPTQIAGYMLTLGFTGVSIYDTFTHGDTRQLPKGQSYVTWGKHQHKLKPIPLPTKPEQPSAPITPPPTVFKYKTDIVGFSVDGRVVEIRGFKRFLGDSTNFIQFIAVQDLACLGFGVDWKDGKTTITKTGVYKTPNLNMDYVIDNMSHALVPLTYNGKTLEIEGHANYDKHGNATRFIPVRNLQGLGFKVEWDNVSKLVVLK